MKAIILAAGRGSRLGPLAAYTSKAALPLLGKSLVTRVFESLCGTVESGAIVVAPEDEDTLRILNLPPWSESTFKVVEQTEPLGSADALKKAWSRVEVPCLVTACDNVVDREFIADFVHTFQELKPDALVAITKSQSRLPASTVQTGEGGQLIRIVERPEPGQVLSRDVALPLYAFGEVIGDVLNELAPSKRGEYEIPQAIQRLIEKGGAVFSKRAPGRITINSPAEYLDVSRRLMAAGKAGIHPGAVIPDGVEITPPVYIERSARIEEGSAIGPYAYLMNDVNVAAGVQVRDSIVFRGSSVAEGSVIREKLVLPDEVIDLQRSHGSHDPAHRQ